MLLGDLLNLKKSRMFFFFVILTAAPVFLSSCGLFRSPEEDRYRYNESESQITRQLAQAKSAEELYPAGRIAEAAEKVRPSVGLPQPMSERGYNDGGWEVIEGVVPIHCEPGRLYLTNDHVAVSLDAEIVVILHNGDELKAGFCGDPTLIGHN